MMEVVPDRLRGETAAFDIIDGEGNVVVETGRRISARHTRALEKAGLTELEVPADYLIGRVYAATYVNEDTGEVIVSANDELTLENLAALSQAGHQRVRNALHQRARSRFIHFRYATYRFFN